jgi:hypothetical protein
MIMIIIIIIIILIKAVSPSSFVATALSGPWPPHSRRFVDHNDAPHSVGLLWTSDYPIAETST